LILTAPKILLRMFLSKNGQPVTEPIVQCPSFWPLWWLVLLRSCK
jgi:hypothetical protein